MNILTKLSELIYPNKFRIFLAMIYIVGWLAVLLAIFGPYSAWWLLAALLWSKFIQLIGHSIGMHRYFSHKSFNTTLRGEKVMAWFSFLLGVGSPIQYARNHRQHHKMSDQPNDWASPNNDGKLYTLLGFWEFNSLSWFMQRGGVTPRDLLTHSTYKFIHDHYYQMWAALVLVTALIDIRIAMYLVVLPAMIYHYELNAFVNMSGHSWGYRNFETEDQSKNSMLVQWWTLGEGLHNNHHAMMRLYDFAVAKGESDVSAWVIEKFFAIPGKQTTNGKVKFNSSEEMQLATLDKITKS